jgi:ankyrin repeat protein
MAALYGNGMPQKHIKVPVEAFVGQELSLHRAARNGDEKKIRKLVSSGAELDQKDARGMTPLIYASAAGKRDAVEVLLSLGADKTIEDDLGYNAYFMAMFQGDLKGHTLSPFGEILELTKNE